MYLEAICKYKNSKFSTFDFIRSKAQVTYGNLRILYNYNEFSINNDKSRVFFKYH